MSNEIMTIHATVEEPVVTEFDDVISSTVQVYTPSGKTQVVTFKQLKGEKVEKGSFGSVSIAVISHSSTPIAIKTVSQPYTYPSEELNNLLKLQHDNVVDILFHFYTEKHDGQVAEDGNVFLHLAMEFFPDSLHRYVRRFRKNGFYVPVFNVKLIMYQVLRGLAYVHSMNLCHRDVKPLNILIDEDTMVVKICDLGSMRELTAETTKYTYVCSRFYRAPELLCGATNYTCAIDMWSAGCTMAEVLIQTAFMPGTDTRSQLAKIANTVGPFKTHHLQTFAQEIRKPMAAKVLHVDTPETPMKKLLPDHLPKEAIRLMRSLLRLVPSERICAARALMHPFFDELQETNSQLRDGVPLPPLFNFSPTERGYLQQASHDNNRDSNTKKKNPNIPLCRQQSMEFTLQQATGLRRCASTSN